MQICRIFLVVVSAFGLVDSEKALACPSIPGLAAPSDIFDQYIAKLQGNMRSKNSTESLSVIYFQQKNDTKKRQFVLIFCRKRASQKCETFIGILAGNDSQTSSDQKSTLSISKFIESDSLPEVKTLLEVRESGYLNYNCENQVSGKLLAIGDSLMSNEKRIKATLGLSEKKEELNLANRRPIIDVFDNLDDEEADLHRVSSEKNAKNTAGPSLNSKKNLTPPSIEHLEKSPRNVTATQNSSAISKSSAQNRFVEVKLQNSKEKMVSRASFETSRQAAFTSVAFNRTNSKLEISVLDSQGIKPANQNRSAVSSLSENKTDSISTQLQQLSDNKDYIKSLYQKYQTLITDSHSNSQGSARGEFAQLPSVESHNSKSDIRGSNSAHTSSLSTAAPAKQADSSDLKPADFGEVDSFLLSTTQTKLTDPIYSGDFSLPVTESSSKAHADNLIRDEYDLSKNAPQQKVHSSLNLNSNKIETKEAEKKWTVIYPNLEEIAYDLSPGQKALPRNELGWSALSPSSADGPKNHVSNRLPNQSNDQEANDAVRVNKIKEEMDLLQKLYLILAYKQRDTQSNTPTASKERVRPTEFLYETYYSGGSTSGNPMTNSRLNVEDSHDSQLIDFARLSSADLVQLITRKEHMLSLLKSDRPNDPPNNSPRNSVNQNSISLNNLVGPKNRIDIPGANINPLLTQLIMMNRY